MGILPQEWSPAAAEGGPSLCQGAEHAPKLMTRVLARIAVGSGAKSEATYDRRHGWLAHVGHAMWVPEPADPIEPRLILPSEDIPLARPVAGMAARNGWIASKPREHP